MRLSLLVEAVDGAVDGTVEVIGVGKGAVGEVVPLEIAPAMLDGIELGGVLGQPLEREPRPLGQGLGRELARMDRPVVHHDDQRLGALAPAIGRGEIVEQIDKVGRALAGAGMHEKLGPDRVESAEMARRLAWPGASMRRSVPRLAQQCAR